jgi:hypothetical protein
MNFHGRFFFTGLDVEQTTEALEGKQSTVADADTFPAFEKGRSGVSITLHFEDLAIAGGTDPTDLVDELRRVAIKLTNEPRDVAITMMETLDLLTDAAYHYLSDYDLAVVREAWILAGYNDGSFGDCTSHVASRTSVIERARRGAYRKNKARLKYLGKGLHDAIYMLASVGAIDGADMSETCRQLWLSRGGHDWGK